MNIVEIRDRIAELNRKIQHAHEGNFVTTLTPEQKKAIIDSNIAHYRREITALTLDLNEMEEKASECNPVLPVGFILRPC